MIAIYFVLVRFSKYKRLLKFFEKVFIILVIMSVLGNIYTNLQTKKYEQTYLLPIDIEEYAIIISEPEETEYKKVYNIKVVGNSENKNKKFILKINKNAKIDLKYGDLIKLKGEYEKPSVVRNYKGFDYSNYLKTKEIYGTIYAQQNNIKILAENQINPISSTINKIRNNIIEKSKQIIDNENLSGMLIGVLVGDTDYIDEETVNNFKNSSLAHILAVSGQHVTYIVLAVSYALNMSKVGKRAGNIISICILLLFMGITGYTSSVFRAVFMGLLIIMAKLVYRKADIYTSMALAMLIMLIKNPFSIYDIGLWLSYGGTIGMVIFNKIFDEKIEIKLKNSIAQKMVAFIKEMLTVTLSAQIMIIPIMALNFNQISVMFWLANILASPIIAICIIAGFIVMFVAFANVGLAEILGIPVKILLNILVVIAEKVANIPFANITIATPRIILVIVYYVATIAILYHKRKDRKQYQIEKKIWLKLKKLSKTILIVTTIMCISAFIIKTADSNMYIHFIDVGQGDSTLIITKTGKKIIIDGGGSNTTYDVGKNTLLPYLLDRKITMLDYAMISHFDSDHCLRSVYSYGKYKSKKCDNIKANREFRKLQTIYRNSKTEKNKRNTSASWG